MHLQGIHVSPFNINKGFSIKRANLGLGVCLKSLLTTNFASKYNINVEMMKLQNQLLPKHQNPL